jgi:hypothetical protein
LDAPFERASSSTRMRSQIRKIRDDLREAVSLATRCKRFYERVAHHDGVDKGDRRALRRASRKIQALADQMPYLMIAHQPRLRAKKECDIESAEWNAGAYENYQIVMRTAGEMLSIVERHLDGEAMAA